MAKALSPSLALRCAAQARAGRIWNAAHAKISWTPQREKPPGKALIRKLQGPLEASASSVCIVDGLSNAGSMHSVYQRQGALGQALWMHG
uniref:Uncharacterized protein n=1 Tax=uncultured bacterium contig00074 TaxID=1181553 RepID=A0A806K1V1_9BACT|nr:hypothetical protein [uncultured bacterium contig00074]